MKICERIIFYFVLATVMLYHLNLINQARCYKILVKIIDALQLEIQTEILIITYLFC